MTFVSMIGPRRCLVRDRSLSELPRRRNLRLGSALLPPWRFHPAPDGLGHEIAGTVVDIGPGVTQVAVGDRVAVNPSVPCGQCRYCLEGMPNHCLDMRFYGSAMRNPHVDGGFREQLTCRADQAHPLPRP